MIKGTRAKLSHLLEQIFDLTDTSLNIAAYRYSTQDYLGLNDALTLIDEVEHPTQDLDPKTMRNYGRMKNQFTVSINQPLRFGKDDYGSFYTSGSWSDYWGAVRAVATIRSATVTALHGEATVSALNDPGMSTAKQKTVFTSAFRYLSKS